MASRMVRFNRFLAAGLLLTLVACPLRRRHTGIDAGDVTVVDAAVGPLAANEDDVARFKDEASLDSADATLSKGGVNVRKAPPNGDTVVVLPKGASVTEVASHDKFVLITFDNPKDSSEKLMGWVPKSSFDVNATAASTAAHPPTKKCGAGLDSVANVGCRRLCLDDDGCPPEDSCSGRGVVEGTSGPVQFCVADNAPPPPPPPPPPRPGGVDAGKGKVDAGVKKTGGR